jgi:putative sterol carrier protein
MADIEPYLRRIAGGFSKPSVRAALKEFTRTLQFSFTDTGETWLIRTADGKPATLSREAVAKPDIAVTISSGDLIGIMNKTTNPVTAYMQGRIRVTGGAQDLMQLRKLLE